MRLTFDRKRLAAAFAIAEKATATRTPREILKNVAVTVVCDAVELVGTDGEIGVRQVVDGAEIGIPGMALLPAKKTAEILRAIPDDIVTITVHEKGKLEIDAGKSQFELQSDDPADFPTVDPIDDANAFSVPGDALRQAIRRTLFATDDETARYALGGVLLEQGGEIITLAATDSRRLSVVDVSCLMSACTDPEGDVIPAKSLSLVDKAIVDGEPVVIAVVGNSVSFRCGGTTIVSRLVEGRFPKYRTVIPASSPIVIDLVAGPFYAAIRQARIMTAIGSAGVDFTFGGGRLELKTQSPDAGSSVVEIPISYDGPDLVAAFNPEFFADFLKTLDDAAVFELHLTDAESPAVARVGSDYTYVIMPLSRGE